MMESTSRATQADSSNFVTTSAKENTTESYSNSKEKKILPGRRQQRHSTEIGSEYHRWWVVRNALGFETNEHIAGLLLDGFHGLLQQLVVMCGGEMYQPQSHGESKTSLDNGDNLDDLSTSPSSSSSFSPFSSSPPGVIEDMEEFTEYKNAITHYCNSLWRMCGQHDSRLEELDRASRPVQEFLMRLMGYITAAKGKSYSLNHKKKRFKPSSTTMKKPDSVHSEPSVTICHPTPSVIAENQFPSPLQAPSLTLLPTNKVIFNQNQLISEQQGWSHNLSASNLSSNKEGFNEKLTLEKENSLSASYIPGEGQSPSTNLPDVMKPVYCVEVPSFEMATANDFQPKLQMTSCGVGHPSLQVFGPDSVCDIAPNHQILQQDHVRFHSQQLPQVPGSLPGQQNSVNQQSLQHTHQHTQTPDLQHPPHQTCYEKNPKEQPRGWERFTVSEYRVDESHQYTRHVKSLEIGCDEKLQEQNHQMSVGFPKQALPHHHLAGHLDQPQGEIQRESQSLEMSSPETSWKNSDKNLVYSQAKMMALPGETETGQREPNCASSIPSIPSSSVVVDLGKEQNEEKLRSLLRKPVKILPYQAVKGNPSQTEVSLQQNLPAEIYEPQQPRGTQAPERRNSSFTPQALAEKKTKEAQTNDTFVSPSVDWADVCGSKSGKHQNQTFNSSSSEMAMISTNTTFYNKIKLNLSNPKIVANVNEVKPNNAQKTITKESFPPIQPALFPNPDNASTVTTPLGTPVIFYPANSFPSKDNSLASLSSLVHNIVYNSHGTILKPLSLTRVNTAVPSSTTYSTPQLLSPPPNLLENSQRKPVATALPVLSRQLNSAKPTLVPFYISHTAMNTLYNLSKCSSLSEATNIPPVSLNSQNLVQLPQQHQQRQQFSSTKLYQDWNLNSTKTSGEWSFSGKAAASIDVSARMNQLKITDVRTCSDNDFIDISDTLNRENVKNCTSTAIDQNQNENFSQTLTSYSFLEHQNLKVVEEDIKSPLTDSAFQPGESPYSECRGLSGRKLDNFYYSSNHLGNRETQVVTSASSVVTQISGYNGSTHFPPNTNLVSLSQQRPLYSKASSKMDNRNLASAHEPVTVSKPSKKILTSYLASKTSVLLNDESNVSRPNDEDKALIKDVIPSTTSASKSCQPTTPPLNELFARNKEDTPIGAKSQPPCELGNTSKLQSEMAASTPITRKKSSRSRRLLCSTCDLVFFSGTDLLVHRYEQHSFVCGECDGRFLSASRLKQHKESDHPHIMVCSYCRFHTYSRNILVDHVSTEHGVDLNGKEKRATNKEVSSGNEPANKTDVLGTETRETGVGNQICEKPSFMSEEEILTKANGENLSRNVKAAARLYSRKTSAHSETLGKQGKEVPQDSFGSDTSHSKLVSEAKVKQVQKTSFREDEKCVSLENGGNQLSSVHPVCSGSVFPSFSCKIEDTTQQDLECISTMYTQVSQHCKLDPVDFLNVSDQHLSENEEPRLVIDTDFSCSRDDESEAKSVGEVKERDAVTYLEQPLCLVMHNRANSGGGKVKPNLRKAEKGFVSRSRLYDMEDQKWAKESVTSGAKAARSDKVICERGDSLKNILRNKSICGRDGGDEKHDVCFVGDRAMDLSLEKLADREKLVMKFSLKRSGSKANELSEELQKKRQRQRRKQKGRKRVDLILANPVVEIDNPETDADPPSYYIINSSTDAFSDGKMSSAGRSQPSSQSFPVPEVQDRDNSELKFGNRSEKGLKFDISELAGGSGQRSGVAVTANIKQPKSAKLLGTQRSRSNQRRSGDRFASAWVHENEGSVRQEKILSLRDRHTMNTLPPKKRRFKKPSWPGKEEKSSDAQNKESFLQLSSGSKGMSRRKDDQTLKAGLRQRIVASSNNRSRQTMKDARRQGRRTRMSSGLDKMSLDVKGNTKNGIQATVSSSVTSAKIAPLTRSTASSSSSDSTSDISNQRYICPIVGCKATFSRKWNMDGHIFKVHSKHSQIECTIAGCDQKFSNRKELRQHVTVVHKGKRRKYECNWPECDKSFFARTHLRIHTLMHTGEKPVACQICDYRCRQRTALIWHMRKHGVFHQAGGKSTLNVVVKDNDSLNPHQKCLS